MARILAVDDSAAMRQMVDITLSGAGHLVKPFNPERLLATIARVLP